MIAETIAAINAALLGYPGPLHNLPDNDGGLLDSRLLGLARPANFAQDGHLTLFLPGEELPVTDDDTLGWLSMHITAGIQVGETTMTYGSYQQPVFFPGFRFILLSRDPSVIGRALMTLPTVPNVRLYDRIEDNALNVMKQYLGYPAQKLTKVDPKLWAWAIPYRIDCLSADDIRTFYAELHPESERYAPQF